MDSTSSALLPGSTLGTLLLVAVLLSGCSKPQVSCGGNMPRNATPAQLELVKIARGQAQELCGHGDGDCDYTVYETKAGQTVKATRVSPYEDKCVSNFGDDQYYSFDESGKLLKVINGL